MQQLLDYNPLQTDGVTIKQATGLITLLCCFCHPRKLRLKKYSRTVCIYCLPWTVANVSFPAGRRKKKACWSRPQLPIAVDNNAYPVLPTTHSPGAQHRWQNWGTEGNNLSVVKAKPKGWVPTICPSCTSDVHEISTPSLPKALMTSFQLQLSAGKCYFFPPL